MNAEYQTWMNTTQKEIILSISNDCNQRRAIDEQYFAVTGSDNPYDNLDYYRALEKEHRTEIVLKDMSWKEAQIFAEPIRIAHPDQCISLSSPDGSSFIANVSWNDQMKMFFGYEVFTAYGEKLKKEANEYAETNGIPMAWE